ncbi:MAG: histidinol-phosphate transaminase [Lentisphaerae bacterium]|nr:histidinol-phosphate transaminase [Lentisphaerota bacterium]
MAIRRNVAALQPYSPGEQPADGDMIKLNTNENPYPPSPRVQEALARLDPETLRRYPDPACGALRQRIAAVHGVQASRVFVGNGSDEVLALCTRAFVEDGGDVGYFEPSYSLYPVLSDIRGAARRPLPLAAGFAWPVDSGGNWDVPDACVRSLFFFTNPNAPTGMQCPRHHVRTFCERAEGVVVLDEAYVDFAREDGLKLAAELDNVLVTRSLSKSFSLAGLRVGYAIGPARLIEALDKVKDSYNVGVVAQRLAAAALSDMEHMRRNVERIRNTRERLRGELAARGFSVCPSETNFLWVKPAEEPAKQVFDRLRANRILVRYFDGPRTADYVRISVGTDADSDALLAALDRRKA